MKRTGLLLLCLLVPCVAGGDDVDRLVDRLFAADAAERAAARREILALGEGALEQVLARIEARQPAPDVVRMYDVRELQTEEKWWKLAFERIRAVAPGEDLRERQGTLIVVAPPAVQELVAAELDGLRRFLGRLIQIDLRVVRLGGAPAALPEDLAEADVAAFLKEHGGETTTSPRIVCRNGQKANVSVVDKVSYVSDVEIEVGHGQCVADPVVDAVRAGVTIDLRPVAAEEGPVQCVVAAWSNDLARPMKTLTIPMPYGGSAQIQVPETRSRGVTALVKCGAGRVAVVDLGGGTLLLLSATVVTLD